MARLDVAGGLAAVFSDHLREVVPRADAFIRIMVDAGVALVTAAVDYVNYGLGEVVGVCRRAHLVEDNLELGLGRGQIQHGPAEVLAELAVEPGGADDEVAAAAGDDVLLAVEFGHAVDTGRSTLLVFPAWGVVWLLTEDVIG